MCFIYIIINTLVSTQVVFFKEHFFGKLLLQISLIQQQYYINNNALIASSLSFCHYLISQQGLIYAILHSELPSCQNC